MNFRNVSSNRTLWKISKGNEQVAYKITTLEMLGFVTQLQKPCVRNSDNYHAICYQFEKIPLFIF